MTVTTDAGSASSQNILSSPAILSVFLKLSVPMAIGMLLNGLHTLVDALFIAQFVGEQAFAAVSAVFPLQVALVALAALFANGASVLLSRSLGAGRAQDGQQIVSTGSFLAWLIAAIVALATWFGGPLLLAAMGLEHNLYADAWTYLMINGVGCLVLFNLSVVADVHRGLGRSNTLFLIILLGALANIALDILLVILLNWGVTGAALATLISQALAWWYGIRALNSRPELRQALRPYWYRGWGRRILLQGLPVTLMYLGGALVMLTCTVQIARLAAEQGESMLAAYGLLGRISIFISLPMIAMTHSCQTLTAYHAGAGSKRLAKQSIKVGLLSTSGYLSLMALLLMLAMQSIAGLFSDNPLQVHMATDIAGLLYLALPLAGISAVAIAALQALGKPHLALVLSLAKTYLFMMPMLVLLACWAGLDMMWYAFPGAELLSVTLVLCLVFISRRHLWPTSEEAGYATGH